MPKKISTASRLLLEFMKDFANATFDATDGFLMSMGSARIMAKNLRVSDSSYNSSIQGMKRHGYIKKVNKDQFLITPKAIKKIVVEKAKLISIDKQKWDGNWRVIFFDIPNSRNRERGIFRSALKRMGFIGIQKSVFIAPFADFDSLSQIRLNLGIEKYVTFLVAKSPHTDDDSALKMRFDLA